MSKKIENSIDYWHQKYLDKVDELEKLGELTQSEVTKISDKGWSEEDEEELGIAIKYLQRAGQWDSATWLKSLKERLSKR